MRKGMVRAWARNAEFRWKADPSFLAASTLDLAPQLRQHPWLVAPRHALPGKAGHIASLMTIQNHLEGFARERSRPVIAPLLAQPIVELCLRIPSWMWCRDGRDRSIARDAFRDLIPKPILDRRAKGTPESFVARLFESTRSRIGDMLLSGELARADMLDRAAIETMLRSPGPVQGAKFVRIMKILDVEMWLRSQMAQMITRSKAVHSQP
jgi:asparagine synthase (glutamine-hydrolysing)